MNGGHESDATHADRHLRELRAGARWRRVDDRDQAATELLRMPDIEPDSAAMDEQSELLASQQEMERLWTERANEYLTRFRDRAGPETKIRDVASIRVAVLDTHVVNAVSYVYGDGSSLILINDALVVLAYEFSRVLASQVTIGGDVPTVSREDAIHTLTSQLDWMRLASMPQSIPLDLTDNRIILAGTMTFVIEYFLIGHEVAHVALGHHRGCVGARSLLIEIGEVPEPRPAPKVTPPPNVVQEEQIADAVAVTMVLETLHSDALPMVDVIAGMAAVYAFVRYLAALEAAVQAQTFPSAVVVLNDQTHPSARARAEQIGFLLKTQITNGDELWGRIAEVGAAWASLFESIGDASERDETAKRTLEAWFQECTGGMVPDYVTFTQNLAAAPHHLMPSLVAAGVQAVSSYELNWAEPTDGSDVGLADADLDRFRFDFERSKLIMSWRGRLDQGVRAAWLAMYRRYGGTAFAE